MAHYIKNKDLLAEVIKSKEQGAMTPILASAFIQLATRYSTRPNFNGYTFREDMVSEALVTLCDKWQQFDESRFSNAFAYYTQIVHNAFIQYLKKEKTQRNIRDAVLVDKGLNPSWAYEDDERGKRGEEEIAGDTSSDNKTDEEGPINNF